MRPTAVRISAASALGDVRIGQPLQLADPGRVPPGDATADADRRADANATDRAGAASETATDRVNWVAPALGVLLTALALGGVTHSLRRDLRRPGALR